MSSNLTNQEIILIGILIILIVICFALISIANTFKNLKSEGIIYNLDEVTKENNIINNVNQINEVSKIITSIDDIKDEDMLVAALVATIDYANEFGNDVVLTSIKQIS